MKTLKYKTSDLPKEPIGEYVLPALTAGVQNQGLNHYVKKDNVTILKGAISISANGANTGATFYQNKEFTVLQDAYAIRWKDQNKVITDNQYLFFVTAISKAIRDQYEWTNKAGWEKIKLNKIRLPIKNTQIDFEFMEDFVAELDAQRIAELDAYLSVSKLKDYTLTEEEEKVLDDFSNLKFSEYNITDIFDIKNTGNILSTEVIANSGYTPYLCASAENNAVSTYIKYNEQYLDKGNCIFIGGKTFVVTYQENDFYSNDSHNLVLYLKGERRTKLKQLYLATCVYKSLKHKYTWGDSVSKAKIKMDKITLPSLNGKPNFEIMEIFITAIQKLVIKDLILYNDMKMAAARYSVDSRE